jgi:hypothetical protein
MRSARLCSRSSERACDRGSGRGDLRVALSFAFGRPAAPDRTRASYLIGWYKALGGALSGRHIFVWSDYI